MNKQDYIEQGRQLFLDGGALLDPAQSWQQKAINEGFESAREEWNDRCEAIVGEFQTVGGEVDLVVTGVTSQDVAQRSRVLSVLGRDLDYSRARELDRLASTARIIANATVPQCEGDHARRSHITDLLTRASSYGVSARGERLLRKALDVAYRLVESRA